MTGTTYFAKKISGVWQHYDLPGDHPLVGHSAPDLELADGSRLAEHMRDGRALLLDPAGAAGARAGGYEDRLEIVTTACPECPELAGLLVRPDGFVAWAAEADHADLAPLETALVTWLGAPAMTGVNV